MRRQIRTAITGEIASIGIGTLIIFVAMALVAGVSASVFIQSAGNLELQSMQTGQETTAEVATGVKVTDVEGQYRLRNMMYNGTNGLIWRYTDTSRDNGNDHLRWKNYSRIHNITITITPNPGSTDIDLLHTLVEISNTSAKCILKYNSSEFCSDTSASGIFTTSAFDLGPSEFSIIVIEDYDSSIVYNSPIINSGDRVFITVNTSACFWGLATSTDVWGSIITEEGASAFYEFRTPATYKDIIYDLF